MNEVTCILDAIDKGDPNAAAQLLPLVYDELRKLASHLMIKESPGQTLQATALVHEAYVRLVAGEKEANWQNRGHFFAAAAEAMRRILIDEARRKRAGKHGGGMRRHDLLEAELAIDSTGDELFAVDDALSRFTEQQPDMAQLVKLRIFVGFTLKEAADCLGLSERTAFRYWAYARAWLRRELDQANDGTSKK